MNEISINTEKLFSAHHMLLGAARMSLEIAREKPPGYSSQSLIVITFSALALEAIYNTIGKSSLQKWSDFESSSPIAKMRILCEHFSIDYEQEKEPWATAIWLTNFRNKIVHAKPQFIAENHVIRRNGINSKRDPKSKIEKQITIGNAEKSYECTNKILELFCECLPLEKKLGILNESSFTSASII